MNELENSHLEEEHRIDFAAFHEKIEAIKSGLSKAVIGQHQLVEQVLIALFANGHVLIEGVPGVAKTLLAKSVSRSVNTRFARIQFTPDLMPSDILGTSIFNQKTQDFELRKGPIYANLVLIDEINRAPAKTQAALFEVMEERQVSLDGQTIKMEEPFMVIATQNPVEHEGTYRLPEAQLDRFMMKIVADYPQVDEELEVLKSHHNYGQQELYKQVEAVINPEEIAKFKAQIKGVKVEDHMLRYINEIVRRTREYPGIFLGASPRAGIAMLAASKVLAAMHDRDFVTPDDIKSVALPVMRHRILLTPEREMEGSNPDDLIREIIGQVEVPR
ncbi:MAG: MoxR family ATPase [Bacteroidetes bacterium]|nr:MAG: MoxR family ATPase [Bacteroidota bacterium]